MASLLDALSSPRLRLSRYGKVRTSSSLLPILLTCVPLCLCLVVDVLLVESPLESITDVRRSLWPLLASITDHIADASVLIAHAVLLPCLRSLACSPFPATTQCLFVFFVLSSCRTAATPVGRTPSPAACDGRHVQSEGTCGGEMRLRGDVRRFS